MATPNQPTSKSPFGASLAALALQVSVQFIVGLALATQYPGPEKAFPAVAAWAHQPFWEFLRSFHYWGSAILIAHSLVHLIAMAWTGRLRTQVVEWYAAVFIFAGSYIAQLTGNPLPGDRHGIQTVMVETSLAGTIPGAGKPIQHLIVGGSQVSWSTINLWFAAHEILVALLLVIGVVIAAKSLKSTAAFRSIAAFGPLAIVLLLALFVAAPLGNAAGIVDFSSYDARVSWYTWPLHGMLEAWQRLSPSLGWVGLAVVPGLIALFAILAPIVGRKWPKGVFQGFVAFFGLAFIGAGLIFGGSVASLTGNRDPIAGSGQQVHNVAQPKMDPALVAAGMTAFNTVGCSGCHGKNGVNGDSGPNLSNEYKKRDQAWLVKFIANPKSLKPNSPMPGFPNLSQQQLAQIAAFLTSPPSP